MNILDTIDMYELGRELQQARIKRGLSEEDAARIIGSTPTTIIAIEKGERRIKAEELIQLAQAYECQVSDFVRPRPKIESFHIQFRFADQRSIENDTRTTQYSDMLEEFFRNYLELEQITGAPLNEDEKLPMRYLYLAIDAFDRELITEGQFARFLGVDRVEARYIAEVLRH